MACKYGDRMFGPKGFTRKIFKVLGMTKHDDNHTRFEQLTSSQLLSIEPFLTEENLHENFNYSPMVKDFIDIARKCVTALFEGYIIDETRDDERFSIEGVLFPRGCSSIVNALLDLPGVSTPDEDMPEWEVNGRMYRRWWWD